MASLLLDRLDARDRELFVRWSISSADRWLARRVWTALTHLGGVICSILAAALPLGAAGALGAAAQRAMATLVISHVVVQLVKRTVGRPRPSQGIDHDALVVEPDRFSFPSGHSAAAMSVALAYSVAFPALSVVLIPLAMLIGMSRVFLGVHYPGDVLIGQLIAVLTGLPILFG
jgi:undecaprenyl-diphosphatase